MPTAIPPGSPSDFDFIIGDWQVRHRRLNILKFPDGEVQAAAFRGANPVWAQAFSGDDGKTWESNWVMEFVRQ